MSKVNTSKEALQSIDRDGLARTVFDVIYSRGDYGATADEVGAALNLPAQTVTPRFFELRGDGDIIRTTNKRTTRSGRNARVHVAKAYAAA